MSHLGLSEQQQAILYLAEKFGIRASDNYYFVTEDNGFTSKVHKGTVKSLTKRGLLMVNQNDVLVPVQQDLLQEAGI